MERRERGQTTLDFAAGIGIFLLVVSFVFLFVPSILDPVSESGQDDRVVADRIATQLATGMLVDTPANPYILDKACTDAFFSDTSPSGCRFVGTSLYERLGIDTYPSGAARHNVQVQLSSSNIATPAPIGDSPPSSSGDIFVARRAVQYSGSAATLTVTVW